MDFRAYFRRLGSKSRPSSIVVAVCLVLISLLVLAQATHQHLNPNEADHCPLCVAMHTVIPAAIPAAIVVLVQVGFSAPAVKARALVRYWHPQLFTRPPPFLG